MQPRLRPILVLGIGIGPIPVVSDGIGIADTAADTRTDTSQLSCLCNDGIRCLLTIHWKQETKLHRQRRRRLKAQQISI